ncbi:MAG: type IX secretion system membrane protein PorP/SprF [Flavobacterium sp.]
MNLKKLSLVVLALMMYPLSRAQEGISVYSDYLSDNLYLLHPSMAGAANCGKVRVTARQQWFGQENAPALQTASMNFGVGERSGIGAILFNDRNGFHSQKGAKLTYAHHIMFSRNEIDLNQLSFGINAGIIQSQLDERTWNIFDPIVGGVFQKDSYFNVDVGASYNFLDFSAHFTIKNLLETKRDLYTDFESDNLRKYIVSAAYVFGDSDRLQWEPSLMFQAVEQTKEKTIDINMKVYKDLDFGKLWGGLSYRRSFDATQFVLNPANPSLREQNLQYITPILGLNYNQFMFAYTYSYLTGDVNFDNSGFHQITIGINLFCKRQKFECNCPAIN